MGVVQAVNGFGQVADRTVTRPFGYGRGLIQMDPAYAVYLSGVYHPVTVSYQGNSVLTRMGNEVDTTTGEPVYTPSQAPNSGPNRTYENAYPLLDGGLAGTSAAQKIANQKIANDRAAGNPEAAKYSGASLVPNPQVGGPQPAIKGTKPGTVGSGVGVYKTQQQWNDLLAKNPQAAGTGLNGPWNPFAGNKGAAAPGLQNLPSGVIATRPGQQSNWMIESSQMETIRDAAVKQYLGANNTWAKGKGVPLGLLPEDEYMGISKVDRLAAIVQVIPSVYTGPRPAVPKDIPRGHPAWDTAARGDLTEYKVYTPFFTYQNAVNSWYDLGLWRGGDAMSGEIQNWKRAFNALGLYAEGSWPNLGTSSWGQSEVDAMAEFMAIANKNPQAAQGPADLPNVRDALLALAAKEAQQAGADSGSGGQTYPFTQKQTSTNVQISNLEDARETLRGNITNMIGRVPTDTEVRQFLGKLNDYERAHPSTTTTTTTYKDANNVTVNSSGPRGDQIDPFKISEDYAKKNTPGDYHAYQQLKYYQALSDVMSSPQGTKTIPEVT